LVKTRHLRGFAAQQHTTILTTTVRHAFDDACYNIGGQLAGRDVVEKEEWPRALDQDVVDAMIDEITTDGVVHARRKSDLELGADAVRGRNQHGLLQLRKRAVKHATEAADLGEGALVESLAREFFDPVSRTRRGIDINTRIAVGNPCCLWLIHSFLRDAVVGQSRRKR